jgi:hypothetical protein
MASLGHQVRTSSKRAGCHRYAQHEGALANWPRNETAKLGQSLTGTSPDFGAITDVC